MKKISKVLIIYCISILLIICLAACSETACEPMYDNECDAICNLCDEERTVTHDFGEADCRTPKVCSICKATDGNALGHSFTDATCTTPKYALFVIQQRAKMQNTLG